MSPYLPYAIVGYAAAVCYGIALSWKTLQIRKANLGPAARLYNGLSSEIFGILFGAFFYLLLAALGSCLLIGTPCLILSRVTGYKPQSEIDAARARTEREIVRTEKRLEESVPPSSGYDQLQHFYGVKAHLSSKMSELIAERARISTFNPVSLRTERTIYDAIAIGPTALLLIYTLIAIDDGKRKRKASETAEPGSAVPAPARDARRQVSKAASAWWLLAIPPAFVIVLLLAGYVVAGLETGAARQDTAPKSLTRNDAPPDAIDRAAVLYKIPSELIRAVIMAESAGDASFVSKERIGLMGMPKVVTKDMYVTDPMDPRQSILGGTRYLRVLANEFEGDMLLTIAAYNAGPDAVREHHGVPPSDETRLYAKKVMAYYRQLKQERRPDQETESLARTPPPPGKPALDKSSLVSDVKQKSHGYACKGDCSGHEAGYKWAEARGIRDSDDCDSAGAHSNSQSFAEGCHAYVDGDSSDSDVDTRDDETDEEDPE